MRSLFDVVAVRSGVALPPEEPPVAPEPAAARPELRLIEARDAKERKCAECGRPTEAWKPVRRRGTTVLLCPECAAKPPPTEAEGVCPSCGALLAQADAFCGRCGTRIEYACPECGALLEPADTFCGKCGTRVT